MNTNYFINARPGDDVYCLFKGNGKIIEIDHDSVPCITVLFNTNTTAGYNIDGYGTLSKVTQSLYWQQPKIIDLGRGMQSLRADTPIEVSMDGVQWEPRLFKHWSHYGKPVVYCAGKKGDNECEETWGHWRMPR